ncbi:hypothetical protein ABT381_06515 [Streptomyces sp. NPDC000151]|uniref:hypothetical protein n=1 Tax=Streptomyces sp. NPDC000151 TaxID=3154244 RepID=UPI00332DCBE8
MISSIVVTSERPARAFWPVTAYDRGVRDGVGFGASEVGGGVEGGFGRGAGGGAGAGGGGAGRGGGAVVAGGAGAGGVGRGGGGGFGGGGFGAGGRGVGDVQGQCQPSGSPGTPVGAVTGGFVPA